MFENLAGKKDCDVQIRRELERARIPQFTELPEESDPEKNPTIPQREVPYTVVGKLNGFEFTRSWRYWTVKGKMPLKLAMKLYNDPVGKTDIRAAGDCACRSPEIWATYLDPKTGKQLYAKTQEAETVRLSKKHHIDISDMKFVESPKDEGEGYILVYHIDTEIGLRVFSEAIRHFKP